jgi:hypothetical protein
MQMLAGIITESQYKEKINENNVGSVDVSLVKDLMNDPNVKKITAKLKADPEALKKTIKFVSTYANKEVPLNENDKITNLMMQKLAVDEIPWKEFVKKGDILYLGDKPLESYTTEELASLIKASRADKEAQTAAEKAREEKAREEAKKQLQMNKKDKLYSIASWLGFPALLGSMMAGFVDSAAPGGVVLVSALTAALLGLGVGALATKGFKEKVLHEEDMSIEDQIQKIIDLGKSM